MKLSEHLENEELERLNDAWKSLTPLQRKILLLQTYPHITLQKLNDHIQRRQTQFAYIYPAHWLKG